jgi:ribonuclease BN (tRNA processing enzyme)
MRFMFLGVSSALTAGYKNFNSNMLLTSNFGKNLLIDCGYDVKHALFEQNMSHNNIDAVYISHLHSDHVGGLEWLGFTKYFIDNNIPTLFISDTLKDKLWNNVLSGGMSCLENEEASIATYFDVKPITQDNFIWENINFKLIKVRHSYSNNCELPCFGLFIEFDKYKIFITTDTRFCPDILMPVFERADLIFHDCETSKQESMQHARYSDLTLLPKEIKEKMWLYDYATNMDLPDAVKDGFKGFVVTGQSFNF